MMAATVLGYLPRKIQTPLLVLILSLYGAKTVLYHLPASLSMWQWHRNLEWRTPKDLFGSGVQISQNNARIQYNLGALVALARQ